MVGLFCRLFGGIVRVCSDLVMMLLKVGVEIRLLK